MMGWVNDDRVNGVGFMCGWLLYSGVFLTLSFSAIVAESITVC